jgi:uncharacterized membrane protein
MATLTAWRFDDPDEAEEAIGVLEGLHNQGLIDVLDAAWVTWPPGTRKPKTHRLHHHTAIGAAGGGFFGFLFGLIFFVPILGLALGAATGAAAVKLGDVGIDGDFVERVRDEVTPGTSAMFALTQGAVEDPVVQAFSRFHAELITSNLSPEQEERLRDTFFSD